MFLKHRSLGFFYTSVLCVNHLRIMLYSTTRRIASCETGRSMLADICTRPLCDSPLGPVPAPRFKICEIGAQPAHFEPNDKQLWSSPSFSKFLWLSNAFNWRETGYPSLDEKKKTETDLIPACDTQLSSQLEGNRFAVKPQNPALKRLTPWVRTGALRAPPEIGALRHEESGFEFTFHRSLNWVNQPTSAVFGSKFQGFLSWALAHVWALSLAMLGWFAMCWSHEIEHCTIKNWKLLH